MLVPMFDRSVFGQVLTNMAGNPHRIREPHPKMFRSAFLLFPLLALTGCGASTTIKHTASLKAAPLAKKTEVLSICSGYGCVLRDKAAFTGRDLRRLRRIMASGRKSAASERRAVARAIATMEKMTRAKTRFPKDLAKAKLRYNGRRGHMDCVDESLNTTAYLRYLKRHGLLRFHTPDRRYAERGLIIDGRYPHKSASMRDRSGTRWTVDSWYGNTGVKPEIMLHSKWRTIRRGFNG